MVLLASQSKVRGKSEDMIMIEITVGCEDEGEILRGGMSWDLVGAR